MPTENIAAELLLEAHGLARRYGPRVAVRDVHVTVRRGEVLGLLGLNGAGKSTILRMLTGVIAPHAGTIKIAGHNLSQAPLAAKRHLGYLPEIPPLYPEATVDEYLDLCAALHGVLQSRRAAAVARAKERCGLTSVGGRLIRNLSKGFQQRVGIAQAIVHEPAVLILDEPTVGLDPAQIHDMRALIQSLCDERAILLSTHLLSEAESVCSRVAVLHQGRIVYDAPLGARAQRLVVSFQRPPPLTELTALAGVLDANALAPQRFALQVDNVQVVAELIAARAVHANWGLHELTLGGSALEQMFLTLTRDHAEVAA